MGLRFSRKWSQGSVNKYDLSPEESHLGRSYRKYLSLSFDFSQKYNMNNVAKNLT